MPPAQFPPLARWQTGTDALVQFPLRDYPPRLRRVGGTRRSDQGPRGAKSKRLLATIRAQPGEFRYSITDHIPTPNQEHP